MRDPLLAGGLAAGYAGFALGFRGPRDRFWQRMTITGASLSSLALLADPQLRRVGVRRRDAAVGLALAAGLYGGVQVGDRLARRLVPRAGEWIDELYRLRELRPKGELAARLLVIAPAEELFWRGFVQRRLQRTAGRWKGAAGAAGLYAGAHLATGNPMLVAAAAGAGSFWSALAAAGVSTGAIIVSHVAWDLWVFLVAPPGPGSRDR